MKLGLQQLSSYQVAALRILSAGIILLPITVKYLTTIPFQKLLIVFLSGTFGSLIPAFLFCIAEEKIDSELAGTLNSLTPVFVIITGVVFFKKTISKNKTMGISIAFIGCILLFISKSGLHTIQHFPSLLLIILATMLYGLNVNMVSKNLLHIPSLHIASIAISLNAVPALLVLIFTGYFNAGLSDAPMLKASAAAVALALAGTAIATIIFCVFVKRAGVIFASIVTYGIPFVAIAWGFIYGEDFGWPQIFCVLVILTGVYFTGKKNKITGIGLHKKISILL